ncbi:hypothetical protein DYB35_010770 [Aphanomyces astaci]|uniref:subtilisin n=1 Tax=Aphanomyces astaci TaxID=112090 RepID=A0A3R7DU61_APHAT|nr:hypothetical protein DYB35_010770 [Aphanomyces astaci]
MIATVAASAIGTELPKASNRVRRFFESESTAKADLLLNVKFTSNVASLDAITTAKSSNYRQGVYDVLIEQAKANEERLAPLLPSGQHISSLYIAGGVALRSYVDLSKANDIALPDVIKGDHSSSRHRDAGNEWGVETIGAPAIGKYTRGKGVVVGSFDSGALYTHEAIKDNWRADYGWFDPTNGTATPYDSQGHGSHTIGTMVGRGGVGVAPDAQWISCTFGDAITLEVMLQRAQFMLCPTKPDGSAVDCSKGVDVINNSWAAHTGYNPWFEAAIAAWKAARIIPLFGIANRGPKCSSAASPGAYKHVIGVGAIGSVTNEPDTLAYFSSKGPVSNGPVNSAYASDAGTSMASPHVAGVVALLKSVDLSLDFDAVYTYLTTTADQNELNTTEPHAWHTSLTNETLPGSPHSNLGMQQQQQAAAAAPPHRYTAAAIAALYTDVSKHLKDLNAHSNVAVRAVTLPSDDDIAALVESRATFFPEKYPVAAVDTINAANLRTRDDVARPGGGKRTNGAYVLVAGKQRAVPAADLPTSVVGKQALISELMRSTKFNMHDIFQMSCQFKELARKNGTISCDHFATIIGSHLGKLVGSVTRTPITDEDSTIAGVSSIGETISASNALVQRLYGVFDQDLNGSIDFRGAYDTIWGVPCLNYLLWGVEFIIGINSLVQGTLEQKLDSLFKMYDKDGSGTISISELVLILNGGQEKMSQLRLKLDWSVMLSILDDVNEATKPDREAAAQERMGLVKTNQSEPLAYEAPPAPLTSAQFHNIMFQYLHDPQADDGHTLQDLFKSYVPSQAPADPSMMLVVDTTHDDACSRFYFRFFDYDCDMQITREQLSSVVCSRYSSLVLALVLLVGGLNRAYSFGTMGNELLETMKLLQGIDANGDGELTKEEYLEAAKKNPLLLASIYICI